MPIEFSGCEGCADRAHGGRGGWICGDCQGGHCMLPEKSVETSTELSIVESKVA